MTRDEIKKFAIDLERCTRCMRWNDDRDDNFLSVIEAMRDGELDAEMGALLRGDEVVETEFVNREKMIKEITDAQNFPSSGRTLYVCPVYGNNLTGVVGDPNAPFQTWQEAFKHAGFGDEIRMSGEVLMSGSPSYVEIAGTDPNIFEKEPKS